MSSAPSTAWPVHVDTSSWQQALASAVQERERLVASVRQELSLLEHLTSQTVAALSACPQSQAGSGSPRSPMNEWVASSACPGSASPTHVQAVRSPNRYAQHGLQRPPVWNRSTSTPSLARSGQVCQSSCLACQPRGLSPASLTPAPPSVQKPKIRGAASEAAPLTRSHVPPWPRSDLPGRGRLGPMEPAQTPPRPRPLVHL